MTVVDISRYQGAVDFGALKAAGVDLVIDKVGGGDAGLYTDARWQANKAGIRAAGIALGSYFFNGFGASPGTSADYEWGLLDWQPGELVVIDVEGGAGTVWSVSQVLTWVQQMRAHGVPAASLGVYMSASVVTGRDWSSVKAEGVFLWVASYGANTGVQGNPPNTGDWNWSLWQYTSNGSVPGIGGRVDVSVKSSSWAGGNVTPLIDFSEGTEMFGFNYTPGGWKFLVVPGRYIKNTPDTQAEAVLGLMNQTVATVNDIGTLHAVLWGCGFDDQFGGAGQPVDGWALLQTLSGGKTLHTTAPVSLTDAQLAVIVSGVAAKVVVPDVSPTLNALGAAINTVDQHVQAIRPLTKVTTTSVLS
jgi:GH25 family lysozyme M1 (1,4-beta-N-acetylmuramidase)